MKVLCYVLGCDPRLSPVVIGTRHKLRGLVTSCAGHNPIPHGYALALVPAPPAPLRATPPPPAPLDGGTRVPRSRPTPMIPPASAARRF